MARQLLLVSSSRSNPHDYLDHCAEQIAALFAGARRLLFVPYARPGGQSHDQYTAVARERFARLGFALGGIQEAADPRAAVAETEGVFIGGGNTFVLLRELQRQQLLEPLRLRIAAGMPYLGTSAGTNLAGPTIGTTNDMPIVAPESLEALGVVPFNLNPHFPHAAPDATHHGESRADRIAEFHVFNSQAVVGLHEDGMLRVSGDRIELIGQRPAWVFRPGRGAEAAPPGVWPAHFIIERGGSPSVEDR